MTKNNALPSETALPSPRDAAQLLTHLVEARPGKHVKVEGGGLPEDIKLLREWQSEERRRQNSAFLDALKGKYEIRVEGPAAALYEAPAADSSK